MQFDVGHTLARRVHWHCVTDLSTSANPLPFSGLGWNLGRGHAVSGKKDGILWQLLEGSPQEWFSFVCGIVVVSTLVWLTVRFIVRMRDGDDPAVTDQQMLTQIAEMHREGSLEETEYRSIKVRLVDRLKEEDIEDSESESKLDG